MNNNMTSIPSSWQPISRDMYLSLVQAGLIVKQYGFSREAVLLWLAHFPGDLWANLLYARVMIGEGRINQAIQILNGLVEADPEFIEASESRHEAEAYRENNKYQEQQSGFIDFQSKNLDSDILAKTHLYILTGNKSDHLEIPSWGEDLRNARLALVQKNFLQVEESIRNVLIANPPTPLACVTHLEYLESNPEVSDSIKRKIATEYHQRWPNTLACKLLLAQWLIEEGESDQAVALLHETVSRDITGQVVSRLWKENNPYRLIWPEKIDLNFDYSIPEDVISYLGWNQLKSGNTQEKGLEEKIFLDELFPETIDTGETASSACIETAKIDIDETSFGDEGGISPISEFDQGKIQVKEQPEAINAVISELVRLGAKRNLPDVINWDGRFPVYVVFSVRKNLESKFGQEATEKIVSEMQNLVHIVQGKNRWNAILFLADDPKYTEPVRIKPIDAFNPWKLKLSLKDLDTSLAKVGEMIGALLIVGGPDIVPFHLLPNPLDDQDNNVPSDNPYATRDTNYFIPEWAAGRIPDGGNNDPTFLLECLQQICSYHQDINRLPHWYQRLGKKLKYFAQGLILSKKKNIGYTAAVWRQASINVFKPIGEEKHLFSSPPMGLNGAPKEGSDKLNKRNGHRPKEIPSTAGKLGYFNLHGLPDALEWYGQRDPDDLDDGSDYPIALRPQDIGKNGKVNGNSTPQVVFSEACYGLHIQEKDVDEAIAMRFLKSGCKAVIGSTCMSYGSISTPLIGADLLGYAFWNFLHDGLPVGEALKKAKAHLAREMHQRQGYLDGEDQKTLISFILLGDPLVKPFNSLVESKSVSRRIVTRGINTICDRSNNGSETEPLPDELQESVRQVVAQYLPGMKDAQIRLSHERVNCDGKGHCCPTSQLNQKSIPNQKAQRQLITLSKMVNALNHNHIIYARVTLSNSGKLVKLVVSR